MIAWVIVLNLLTLGAIAFAFAVWRVPDWFRRAFRPLVLPAQIVGWFFFAVFVFASATLAVGIGLNFLVGGATLVVLAMVFNRRARARRDALTELLAVCSERGMPLEPVLIAFADESSNSYGRRVGWLVERLDSGIPLPEALSAVRGLVSPQTVCAAKLGTRSGRLGAALRDTVALQQGRGPLWNQMVGRSWLTAWPVFGMLGVMMFWGAFIYPKFVQIWDDFGMNLPAPSRWLGSVASTSGLLPLNSLFAMMALLLLGWMLLAYIGWVPMAVPLPGRWLARLEGAPILRGLSLFCNAGRPMSEGLRALAESYPKPWVRQRLRIATDEVERGGDWPTALANARLVGSADAALFRASTQLGNVSWTLRVTADAVERRFIYRMLALLQVLFPVAMLAIGTMVLVVLLATFSPLSHLIEALAE